MLDVILKALEKGPVETSIIAIGGNMQVTLKVKILAADATGILCQTKGMMGGYGNGYQLRPWASIGVMSLDQLP